MTDVLIGVVGGFLFIAGFLHGWWLRPRIDPCLRRVPRPGGPLELMCEIEREIEREQKGEQR